MINVCDAIMGNGKSQSAISYINEHPDQKIIYITPYLDEAERIKNGCKEANFIEPSNKIPQFNFRKTEHAMELIRQGKNITTTHQAFKMYTPEILDSIRRQEYVLIIDESVDVLEPVTFHPADLELVIRAGYVKEENDIYKLVDDSYTGTGLTDIFTLLRTRELIKLDDEKAGILYYWSLPLDLFTSFKDVYILTYMFESQSLHHFIKMHGLPFRYIGIEKNGNTYRFSDVPKYTPGYVEHIKDMITIIDGRINDIGDKHTALSMTWFDGDKGNVKKLKDNIYNCFNNKWKDHSINERLWGTYSKGFNPIKGKGYTKAFLNFNAKATNNFRDRTCLVYAANIFMNVSEKIYYARNGITVDEDMYALSIMVQWIWRSAIRDGKHIYLYIPSKRMRTLLINWMNSLSKENAK